MTTEMGSLPNLGDAIPGQGALYRPKRRLGVAANMPEARLSRAGTRVAGDGAAVSAGSAHQIGLAVVHTREVVRAFAAGGFRYFSDVADVRQHLLAEQLKRFHQFVRMFQARGLERQIDDAAADLFPALLQLRDAAKVQSARPEPPSATSLARGGGRPMSTGRCLSTSAGAGQDRQLIRLRPRSSRLPLPDVPVQDNGGGRTG
jgi:hypothetical protein